MPVAKKAVKPPVKPPVKAAKKVAKDVDVDEAPKPRGRQRDSERDANDLAIVLENTEVTGEFPFHRVKGVSAAAEAAGTDPIRVRALLDRHLAEERGIEEATPEAITEARESGLNWGVIDAMFGISRSKTLALYDEANGEGAHRLRKLYGGDGAERIKPEAEPKPKAEKKPKAEAGDLSPRFDSDTTKEAIVAALNGKTVTIRVRANGVESTAKVKVTKDTAKVGVVKGERVVRFTDGKGNARTVAVASFLK
jgi:hypothetical protein